MERESLLARLRERAEGVLLVSGHGDEEIVFCGDQKNAGYVGWTPRSTAEAIVWSFRANPDAGVAALLKATDAAWAAVAANYDTAGLGEIHKQALWTALADLETALREVGYAA